MRALKYNDRDKQTIDLNCRECKINNLFKSEYHSSIIYAKHIQESVLPKQDIFNSVFQKSFVLYQPRDVVSGDLYWFSIKNGKIIISMIDCTGHGVPGALLSMIANNLLNQIINEKNLTCPSNILSELNRGLKRTFNHNTNGADTHDGMSIAVCSFDLSFKNMIFSGADMPVYILREDKVEKKRGDKYAIGKLSHGNHFLDNYFDLQPNDRVYLLSDGLFDQFGGPEDRKFMERRFTDLIRSHRNMEINEQGTLINKIFLQWKGKQRQTDDVTVIGIEV